jgi:hypothetical protein
MNLEEMNTSEGDVLQEENQEVENPVINQNDQMGPVMAMLNQLQQQLVNAQAEITALKNKEAVPPEPEPEVQPLLGEPAGTILRNGRGDVIFVEEHYFIRDPPAPHAMSEAEKSSIKAPQIKEEIAKMDGAKWLLFAQEVAFYYKRGGEKPIASYVSSKNLELLALKFHMELSAFLALTPQKQVYQFLKSFWEKPEERPGQLLEDIRKIELLPAAKGNVEMVVLEFMMRVKTVMNGVAFTKQLLGVIRDQVLIEDWVAEFATRKYNSYQDFYNHLRDLAVEYDQSTLTLVVRYDYL